MKTWTNKHHPKTSGPWDGEPDKAQWIDEATGFDCLMVRNQFGALCGYVGLPPAHPLHGQDYNDVDAHVHGGLTFAGPCREGAPEDQGVCHVPEAGRPDKVWWLGFDCAHAGDWAPDLRRYGNDTYRTFDYVQHQCAVLAGQLAAHSPDYVVPANEEDEAAIARISARADADPCAGGKCTDPEAHAEGAHDL